MRKHLGSRGDGFSVRDLRDFGQNSQSFPLPTRAHVITSSREIANDPESQPAVSGDRAANCAVVALCLLGATTGTDREVDPAVGESFVVMFEEQSAPMRRENTISRLCPTRVVATQDQSRCCAVLAGAGLRPPVSCGFESRTASHEISPVFSITCSTG